MEEVLSFLLTEPWSSIGSTFLDAERSSTFLIGAGLLLLYLWYLTLKPFLPLLCKTKDTTKPQGRAKKGRKPTSKDQRTWQREAEEVRKLLSVVQSHPDQPYDPMDFRLLLCPDPLCGFCTTETAKVSRLLSQASLEDDDSSLTSWASAVSVTETSFSLSCTPTASPQGCLIPAPASESSTPYPSTVSPKEVALEDLISAPPIADSLPPESVSPFSSKFPVGYISVHQPPSFPPPTRYSTDPVVQLQAVHSIVCRPSESSTDVPATKDTDRAICPISKSPQQQSAAHNLPPLNSVQSTTQELPETHSLQSSLWGEATASPVETGNHSSTNPGDVTLLEIQDQRKEYFLFSNRIKSESLQKPSSPSGTASESEADPQDLAVSHTLGGNEGKPEEMPMYQQSPDPKASEEQEENKHKRLFLGHPSLHSEPLIPMASGTGDRSEQSAYSNRISASPVLTHPAPLSSAESQPQSLPQILPPSQSEQLPLAETKVQPQPPVLVLPSSAVSQFGDCEVCLHSSQDEAQPLMPSQIHCLEYNILKDEQGKEWGSSSVINKSPKEYCPPAPKLAVGEKSSRAQVPRSIPPADFPLTSELRKKMEHHLQKRLIQQCWGLPKRVLESWSQMGFQMRPLGSSSESRNNYGKSTGETGRVLMGTLGLQDPKTPNCKNQLCSELSFQSEGGQHIEAQGPTNKMSLYSEELRYKPLITHEQSPTSGDRADPPVLRVLLPPGGSSMEQQKGASWAPARAFGSCVNQSSPAAHRRKFPQSGKTGELGGGDTGLGPSQPPGRMHAPQPWPPGDSRGCKSSPSLSKKGQPSPDNLGRKQIKHFLQWLCPGRTCKGLQRSPEKSPSASSSLQGTGHGKGQAAFPAHDVGKRTPSSTETVLQGERGLLRTAGNAAWPQGSPLPGKSDKPQHKEERPIQAEPGLSHHLHYEGACSEGTPTKSYSQATVTADQHTWIGHRDGQTPKCVALQEKSLCHRNPSNHAKQGAGRPTKVHLQQSTWPAHS